MYLSLFMFYIDKLCNLIYIDFSIYQITYTKEKQTMVDYQKLYTIIFNAVTDALNALDEQNAGQAKEILRTAQQAAEERYMETAR